MKEPSSQPPTLDDLRVQRDDILRVAAAHHVAHIRVFGSVARGDAGATSDIDFVVDLPPDCRGFDFFGVLDELGKDLAAVLGRPVDVVSIRSPFSRRGAILAQRIQQEALDL